MSTTATVISILGTSQTSLKVESVSDMLRGWLEQEGLDHLVAAPFEVDRSQYEHKCNRCRAMHPEYDEEMVKDWAIFSIVARKQISKQDQDSVGPEAAKSVARVAHAGETLTREIREMIRLNETFVAGHGELKQAVTDEARQIRERITDVANGAGQALATAIGMAANAWSARLEAMNMTLRSIRTDGIDADISRREEFYKTCAQRRRENLWTWVWRFLILLAIGMLLGVQLAHGQGRDQRLYKPMNYRPGVLRMTVALPLFQDPAGGALDPASQRLSIQWRDEGSNVAGGYWSAGVKVINCVGAGVTCTRSGNIITITVSGGGGSSHEILSATHTDSLTGTVVRGDVIVGNLTPKWARLAKGTADQAFRMDGTGTDPGWGTLGFLGGGTNQTSWTAARCVRVNAGGTALESAAADCGAGGGTHEILSATHTDTTAAAVVRGDIIGGIGATPKWERIAHPAAANRYLKSGATEFGWSSGAASGTGSPTACTNQVVTVFTLNSDAAPTSTCATITSAFTSGTFAPTAHNLLSASHGDSTAAAAARGSIIAGIGASPLWTRVDSTTTDRYFKRNGSGDIVESTLAAAGIGTPADCTNQFVTDITLVADAAPTSVCTTATLASAQYANQGTVATVLHGNAAGNPSFGAIVTADITNDNVTRDKVSTPLRTWAKSIVIFDPVTGDTNRVQLYFHTAVTITRVVCSVAAATSVTIQLDERAEATPNTAGSDVLSAGLACDVDSQATTGFANATIATRVPLNLQITAVSGTPGTVRIHIEGTID